MTETCEVHELFATQVEFSSNQHQEGSPETEALVRNPPQPPVERQFFNERVRLDANTEVEIWSFEDDTSGRGLPAPLVRTTEGDVFQAYVKPGKGPHTIHWHGIEPDPRNDGVGHTSFEVTGGYLYQWQTQVGLPGDPNTGTAGSYFYHCHVNTVLHVQMGMFGPLIVDPRGTDAVVAGRQTRRAFVDGPRYDVATETLFAPYSADPSWHDKNHAAGLSGEDEGLNDFRPTAFVTLGAQDLRKPWTGGGVHRVERIMAVRAERPQWLSDPADVGPVPPTLLRILNANYFPAELRFTLEDGYTPVALGEVIAHDGRPYRDTSSPYGASPPIRANAPLDVQRLAFGAAERYDILVWPEGPGRRGMKKFLLHFDWHHWVERGEKPLHTKTIPLMVVDV